MVMPIAWVTLKIALALKQIFSVGRRDALGEEQALRFAQGFRRAFDPGAEFAGAR